MATELTPFSACQAETVSQELTEKTVLTSVQGPRLQKL